MRNKLRMILALLLAACMMLPALSLAEGDPTLDGVRDQSVMAGTEFDALAGITAADAEGNDLTNMIMIESLPALNFRNGKATPENPGDYELVYSVTDDNGVFAGNIHACRTNQLNDSERSAGIKPLFVVQQQ